MKLKPTYEEIRVRVHRDKVETLIRERTADITVARETVKAVNRELRFTKYALDNAADAAFWLKEGEPHFIYVNEKACEQLKYTKEELLSMGPDEIDALYPKLNVYDKLVNLKPVENFTFETINRRKDGTECPVEVSGYNTEFEGERYFICFTRDITERVKAQMKLESAYDSLQREMKERNRLEKILIQKERLKTLGTIAAEFAHEIRNPLLSIGGFAQRLKQKSPDFSECDIILKESQRLEKILSRLESYLEPVEFFLKECSLNTIINDCLRLLSPEMKARKVKCIVDLDPKVADAYTDADILEQIFIDLIRDVAETMDKPGELFVRSFQSDQELHAEFKNRAEALESRFSETLFKPFSAGDGIFGLPLCYRLIKDMGGLLSFEQEDGWIVFTVSIPKIGESGPDKTD